MRNFLPDFRLILENQQGMSEGVVADNVSSFDNFAGDVRTLLHVASNQKKSCVHAVLGENFEQPQSVRIVGAVVIGQCDLSRARARPMKVRPYHWPVGAMD